ncbi:MAG: hypothetical protein Q7S33_03920 [Nanoarchaeota archaeon]|nr:hypothetical protein [Nanoarchaeota archaeon]
MKCKKCDSTNTVKAGFRNKKQYFKCKKCSTVFSFGDNRKDRKILFNKAELIKDLEIELTKEYGKDYEDLFSLKQKVNLKKIISNLSKEKFSKKPSLSYVYKLLKDKRKVFTVDLSELDNITAKNKHQAKTNVILYIKSILNFDIKFDGETIKFSKPVNIPIRFCMSTTDLHKAKYLKYLKEHNTNYHKMFEIHCLKKLKENKKWSNLQSMQEFFFKCKPIRKETIRALKTLGEYCKKSYKSKEFKKFQINHLKKLIKEENLKKK